MNLYYWFSVRIPATYARARLEAVHGLNAQRPILDSLVFNTDLKHRTWLEFVAAGPCHCNFHRSDHSGHAGRVLAQKKQKTLQGFAYAARQPGDKGKLQDYWKRSTTNNSKILYILMRNIQNFVTNAQKYTNFDYYFWKKNKSKWFYKNVSNFSRDQNFPWENKFSVRIPIFERKSYE